MHSLFAAISGSALLNGFIFLLIIGLVCGLLLWLVGKSPVPDPIKPILTWILYAVMVIFVINFLLGLINKSFITL